MNDKGLQTFLILLAVGVLGMVAVAGVGGGYLLHRTDTELQCERTGRLEFDSLVTALGPEMAALGGEVASVNSCDSVPTPGTALVISFPAGMDEETAVGTLTGLGWEGYEIAGSLRKYMKSPDGNLHVTYDSDGAQFGPERIIAS